MLDLHIHTRHSDGALNVIDILKIAEESKLKYISITDHNTVDAYESIQKNIFSGKIIPGIEVECRLDSGIVIEVLAYSFDVIGLKNSNFMKKWFPLSFKKHYANKFEEYKVIFKNMGAKFDEDLTMENSIYCYANLAMIENIFKYPENKKLIELLGISNSDDFREKHVFNKNSPFYDDLFCREKPGILETIEVLKSYGSKVFLAHPFRYKAIEGKVLIDEVNNLGILDGLECINKATTREQTEYLIDFCEKNKLLKSGGSDFHRPLGYERGNCMGFGDWDTYPIEISLVEEWIDNCGFIL